MTDRPLISVVVPVYNVEKYLDRCLNSIVNQTYDNLEILLVVQPSKDNSQALAEEWASRDERIRIVYEEMCDLANARNVGLNKTTGGLITYVDSDDLVHQRHIEILYNAMSENQLDIAECLVYSFMDDTTILEYVPEDQEVVVMSGREFARCQLENRYGSGATVVQTKLYKRSVFDGIGFPTGRLCEDMATTYKLYWAAEKVGLVYAETYFYQSKRGDSITHDDAQRARVLFDSLTARMEQIEFYADKDEKNVLLAKYAACNIMTRIRAELPDEVSKSHQGYAELFEQYKGWVLDIEAGSVGKRKRQLVTLGYKHPGIWYKIWTARNKHKQKREWKFKG